jgi:formamidopyrimidine-DNA glycosylase
MPELPEVETMRRGIQGIVGARITSVEVIAGGLKPIRISPRPALLCRRTSGCTITAIERYGKRVALRLDSQAVLVFEPRMTGLVLLADPPDREHLRLRVRLAGVPSRQLLFWDRRGLGSVRLLQPRQLLAELGPEKLGPDALEITAIQLRERLHASRRAIKVALLDQHAVAGIGNLYAAEILHAAAIQPAKRCDRLTSAEWAHLHAALRHVLSEAVRYEGSTLSDGTYRNALNTPGSYQNHHRVYGRAGQPCPTCGAGPIRRIVQAQRATFFCPACQASRRDANWSASATPWARNG